MDSLLAGPWDRLAFEIDLAAGHPAQPRWYNGERAIILQLAGEPALLFKGFPNLPRQYADWYAPLPGETAGFYQLARVNAPPFDPAAPDCFENGLCLLALDYDMESGAVDLVWELARPLDLPPIPVVSNPPPPGVYAGPRLAVFAHLWTADNQLRHVDDGFWLDPKGLKPGDRFVQRHWLPGAEPGGHIAIGLYDPFTGERIWTVDGREMVERR